MLEYLKAGGLFMWPILLASVCGIAVILEKVYYFLKNESDMNEKFKKNLIKLIKDGDNQEVIKFCKTKKNSVAKTIMSILETFDAGIDNDFDCQHLEEVARESTLSRITALEKGMWLLNVVATAGPQLGLLGTVTGMVTAFKGLAGTTASSSAVIAAGISEALYTTAFGLIVGIPALVAYTFFERKIDCVLIEIEKTTVYLTNDLRNKSVDRKKCNC